VYEYNGNECVDPSNYTPQHYGDAMYVSFYDRIRRQEKKRKLGETEDASDI
jgi:hypothetical protein